MTNSISSNLNSSSLQQTNNQSNNKEVQKSSKEIVEDAIDTELLFSDCKPTDDSISFLDKTYNQDEFICAEHKGWGKTKTIVKEENNNLLELAGKVIFESKPEKIVEEYDKHNKLCKKTYYDENGKCTVTTFDSDGEKKEEVIINKNEIDDSHFEAEIRHSYYTEKGTSVKTTDYNYNENCKDGKPLETSKVEYFNPDGSVDYATQFLYNFLHPDNTDKA